MEYQTHDKLGRITPFYDEADYSIVYRPLALPGFDFIHRHGYANTPYLIDYIRSVRQANPQTIRWLFRDMRKGGYVYLPLESQVYYPRNKFFIYKGTDRMVNALIDEGYETDVIPVSQVRVHDYATAVVTGSIELGFRKLGIEYVPGHFFLKRAKTTLTYNHHQDKAPRPDQLFAGDYGDGKRALYVVEMDMGTEQKSQHPKRKTYDSMIDCLTRYVAEGRYKDHLGVTVPMKALVTFARRSDELAFHKRLALMFKKCDFILTRVVSGLKPHLVPERPDYTLVNEGWNRHGYQEPYLINRP
jgi:hypothetical protein